MPRLRLSGRASATSYSTVGAGLSQRLRSLVKRARLSGIVRGMSGPSIVMYTFFACSNVLSEAAAVCSDKQ